MSLYRRAVHLSRAKAAVIGVGLLFFAAVSASLLRYWDWMEPLDRAITLFGVALFGSFSAFSLLLLALRRPVLVVDYDGIEALFGYSEVLRFGWDEIEGWDLYPEGRTPALLSWLVQPSLNIRLKDEAAAVARLGWAGRLSLWSNMRFRGARIIVPAALLAESLDPVIEVMRQLHPGLERRP